MDHRGVDHHVVVDELGRPRGVGQDPADRARDQEDVLGPVGPEPVVHRRLVAQVELVAGGGEEVAEPSALQAAHESAEPTRPPWPATKMREVLSMLGPAARLQGITNARCYARPSSNHRYLINRLSVGHALTWVVLSVLGAYSFVILF